MPRAFTRTRRIPAQGVWLAALFLLVALPASAQEQRPQAAPANATTGTAPRHCTDLEGHELPCPVPESKPAEPPKQPSPEKSLPKHLLLDQKSFWTAPSRLRERDLPWLVPFGAITAVTIASDNAIERKLPTGATVIDRSRQASNAGVAALTGTAGALYLFGHISDNSQRREAGLLSFEAAVNSLAVTQLMKFGTRRERPGEGSGRGEFWQEGGDSFPSQHAAVAWSVAEVLANEYSGPLSKLLAYGTATGVTATRVIGRRHFASDVLIGSALGWYLGRQVFRAHSEQYSGQEYGTFSHSAGEKAERLPSSMGSPYVPPDSWVYPAFDRLVALGLAESGIVGLRPWTRMECARLLNEAGDILGADDSSPEAAVYRALAAEFSSELGRLNGGRNLEARVESVYTRFTGISGDALADGYHFGQTLINDYGRPYSRGFNAVTGASTWAVAGPLAFYLRGEYQHAPSTPAYPEAVRTAIAGMDVNPLQPPSPVADLNRARLLDAYVATTIRGFQLSFGRQSMWWGPGRGGPLLFSDNAEPLALFRISQVTPTRLPSIFELLGPVRTEFFYARMSGHHFPAQPYMHGQKISFKPTPNLEFGFSRAVVFGGSGHPVTLRSFWHSFASLSSDVAPGSPQDPGDRRGGFDFSYRIPGLRDWLVLYNDSLVDDDPSPLAAPRRAAMSPGIYLPQIPKLRKLDFRAEAAYTDVPASNSVGGRFIYWNGGYHDSHTNRGNLMGSWIGREAKGVQLWSTYWLSPRNTIQVGYRGARVSKDFVPAGGTLNDFSARADLLLRHDMGVSSYVQWERWNFPLLATSAKQNVSVSVQLTFWPGTRLASAPKP